MVAEKEKAGALRSLRWKIENDETRSNECKTATERRMMFRAISLLLLYAACTWNARGQNTPIGDWETHFNYLSAKQVVHIGDHLVCASHNGLFSVKQSDKTIRIWTKADGLSETGISSMSYDPADSLLLLAYRSGNLDLVYLHSDLSIKEIVPWKVFENASNLPENRSIRRIVLQDGATFLCTNFGIVVLNTRLRQVQETYRYIGKNGVEVSVRALTFSSDSLFALTSQGLLAASASPAVNRQFFESWKNSVVPPGTVELAYFHDRLFAGVSQKGVFSREGSSWKSVYTSAGNTYSMNSEGDVLTTALDREVLTIDLANKTTVTACAPVYFFTQCCAGGRGDLGGRRAKGITE